MPYVSWAYLWRWHLHLCPYESDYTSDLVYVHQWISSLRLMWGNVMEIHELLYMFLYI